MLKLMLSSQAPRETQVLEVVMKGLGFNVIQFDPKSRFFIKMLQFMPDVIFMEIPAFSPEHIGVIDLMQRHKAISRIPIVGFGPPVNPDIIKGVFKQGINEYIPRPLTLDVLKKSVVSVLTQCKKSMDGAGGKDAAAKFDFAMILDQSVAPMKKIEAMSAHVSKLLAFPFTVPRVLQITSAESKGAGELARVIESDPVITTQILKISNTVFFASMNRRISSVKDAVIRLGFSETKRIVMGMAVMKLFDNQVRNDGFDRVEFWHHSIATAIIAERLGRRMSGLDNDEVFISGLMHDLGILIMDEFFPELLAKVITRTSEEGVEFVAAEKAVMGVTHYDITAVLFEKWKMHEEVSRAVLEKDLFRNLGKQALSSGQKMSICIGIAETVVKTVCVGRECDEFIRPINNDLLQMVKMNTGFTDSFLKDVYRDMGFYRRFFNLAHSEFPTRHEGIKDPEQFPTAIINLAGCVFVPAMLYLAKEKVPVETFLPDTPAEDLDGRFDVLILWCDGNTQVNTIAKYLKVVRRKSDAHPVQAGKVEYTPVLACVDPDTMLHKFPELAEVSIVPKHIDMRKLDRAMCEIAEGKRVEFTVYSIAPMPPPSAPATAENADTGKAQDRAGEKDKKTAGTKNLPAEETAVDGKAPVVTQKKTTDSSPQKPPQTDPVVSVSPPVAS
jgi:HD-like signal output (HDOD) protein